MGSGSVGEGSSVDVTSAEVVGSVTAGRVVAVAGMTVGCGKTAVGLAGGIGVDASAGAMTIGVGVALPHPLKKDIIKIITTPHCTECRLIR